MASFLEEIQNEIKVAEERAEKFIELNNTRINCSEIALSIIGMNCCITGSRSEGVHQNESDTDVLIYGNDIEFADEEKMSTANRLYVTVETTDKYPGYALLRVNEGDRGRDLELLQFLKQPMDILCNEVKGSHYLSTHKTISAMSIYAAFKLPWTGGTLTLEENSGPAKHVTVEMGNRKTDLDILYAIQSNVSARYMDQWKNRTRFWPSLPIVKEIIGLPVFVVPLSHPLCEEEIRDSQWKFSFNLQERFMMRSLNGAQIISCNLFKVLKQHLKQLEDTTNSDQKVVLKSYYFKTCFLWTLEQIQESNWCEKNIVDNTISCVRYLTNCLRAKQCPHIFIPENNLFEGKDIISTDTSALENFLASICDKEHHLWKDLMTKVLLIHNKMYMQKQPMLNCVSTCRHILVQSVKNENVGEALHTLTKRYKMIDLLEIKNGNCDTDWKNSILQTLQSVIGTLQCIMQKKVEKSEEEKHVTIDTTIDTYETIASTEVEYEDRMCDFSEDNSRSITCATNLQNVKCKNNQTDAIKSEVYWKDLLHEASEMDFCSGKLKEATVQFWLKDLGKAKLVTSKVIERNAVDIMHHTGFNHVRDKTFNDAENSKKDWISLVQNHVNFDVFFIPAEISACPPAIQLQLCEGRGLTLNPLVYAFYLHYCIMQQENLHPTEVEKHLARWQTLLDNREKAGYSYIDWELIAFCYLQTGKYEAAFQNLLAASRLRDMGRAHHWLLGLVIFHSINAKMAS